MSQQQQLIDQTFLKMLHTEPFYAFLMIQFEKILSNDVPIAGVSVDGASLKLYLNPETFCKFSLNSRVAIMRHEMLHVILEHFVRKGVRHHELFNIASDMAVNSLIDNLPSEDEVLQATGANGGLVLAEKFELPPGQLSEWYYDELIERFPPNPQAQPSGNGDDEGDGEGESKGAKGSGNGEGTIRGQGEYYDSHESWSEGSPVSPELAKEIVKDAIQNAMKKSRGDIPGNLEEYIKELLRSDINWKSALRGFVARAIQTNKKYTWKRPSKRYENNKGVSRDVVLNLAVAIDTSGSVATEELALFMGEIESIYNTVKCNIKFIQFDTKITSVDDYTRNYKVNIKGRGGTDLCVPFDFLNEQKERYDGLVVFTDTFGPTPQKQTIPTLWGIVSEQGWGNRDKFCKFGQKMYIMPKGR